MKMKIASVLLCLLSLFPALALGDAFPDSLPDPALSSQEEDVPTPGQSLSSPSGSSSASMFHTPFLSNPPAHPLNSPSPKSTASARTQTPLPAAPIASALPSTTPQPDAAPLPCVLPPVSLLPEAALQTPSSPSASAQPAVSLPHTGPRYSPLLALGAFFLLILGLRKRKDGDRNP